MPTNLPMRSMTRTRSDDLPFRCGPCERHHAISTARVREKLAQEGYIKAVIAILRRWRGAAIAHNGISGALVDG